MNRTASGLDLLTTFQVVPWLYLTKNKPKDPSNQKPKRKKKKNKNKEKQSKTTKSFIIMEILVLHKIEVILLHCCMCIVDEGCNDLHMKCLAGSYLVAEQDIHLQIAHTIFVTF